VKTYSHHHSHILQKDHTIKKNKRKSTCNEEKKSLDLYHHVLTHVEMTLLIL
jgi:hypothetical protein